MQVPSTVAVPEKGWGMACDSLDFVPAIAAGISLISVLFAWRSSTNSKNSAENSLKATREASIRQQMSLYLTEFGKLRDKEPKIIHDDYFYASCDWQLRSQLQILAGLLVSLVETMHQAEDLRTKTWLRFIGHLPGVLLDPEFTLEHYAATLWMKAEIVEHRSRARKRFPRMFPEFTSPGS